MGKRLYRSRSNRKISGVIGGVSEYFRLDATLLRVLFVIGLIASFGTFLLIYLVAAVLLPNEENAIR